MADRDNFVGVNSIKFNQRLQQMMTALGIYQQSNGQKVMFVSVVVMTNFV